MTLRKSGRYALERAKIKAQVLAWLVEGRTVRAIAAELSTRGNPISYQAVAGFAKRHASELERLRGKVEERAVEQALEPVIAQKAWRLGQMQELFDSAKGVLLGRGPMAREPKWLTTYIGLGEAPEEGESRRDEEGRFLVPAGQVLTSVEKFDKALFDTLQGLMQQAADETGQLVKRGQPLGTPDEGAGPLILNINVITLPDGRVQAVPMIEGQAVRK